MHNTGIAIIIKIESVSSRSICKCSSRRIQLVRRPHNVAIAFPVSLDRCLQKQFCRFCICPCQSHATNIGQATFCMVQDIVRDVLKPQRHHSICKTIYRVPSCFQNGPLTMSPMPHTSECEAVKANITCYFLSKYPALTAVPIRLQINLPAVMAVIPFTSRLGVISTISIPTTLPFLTKPWIRVRIWE